METAVAIDRIIDNEKIISKFLIYLNTFIELSVKNIIARFAFF